MAESQNIFQKLQTFGQQSGLADIAKVITNAAQEVKNPGYMQRQQQLDLQRDQFNATQSNNDLNAQLEILRTLPPGSEAYNAAAEAIKANPVVGQLLQKIQGKRTVAANAPYGVSDDKIAELNNAQVDAMIKNPLKTKSRFFKQGDKWYKHDELSDTVTPVTPDEVQAAESSTAEAATTSSKSLADMLSGSPQETGRRWWDDTVSPENVKLAVEQRVQDLQLSDGISRDEARLQAENEYSAIKSGDTGVFQKYPDVDVAQLFADNDARRAAIQNNKVVVDTGDGVQNTPNTLADLGIKDPDTAEQFTTLEKMMPNVDMRTLYKQNPQAIVEVLTAIRDGVPDGKGGKQKLSIDQIRYILTGNE